MKRQISILFLALLLSPTIISSSITLMGHSHEVCTEDGIHHHDQIIECELCLFNNINAKKFSQLLNEYQNFENYYIHIYNSNDIVYLFKLLTLSNHKRGPPSYH